jgi:ACS family hexuronate transporter-like MFS transporter
MADAARRPLTPSTRTQRWFVATMLFLAAVLNYVDRSVLAILAPTIQRDLAIDEAGYSQIVNAFLVAYTASYLLSGWIVDRIGGMRSLGAFVGFWSLANAATGLAGSATSLGAARFLLGLGEAGGWTASPKITSQFFSERERAAVIGIYTAGGTVGATRAAPGRLAGWPLGLAVGVFCDRLRRHGLAGGMAGMPASGVGWGSRSRLAL